MIDVQGGKLPFETAMGVAVEPDGLRIAKNTPAWN